MNDSIVIPLQGIITAQFFDQSNLAKIDRNINKRLIADYAKGIANGKQFAEKYLLGKLKQTDVNKNVICNAGFSAFARTAVGDTGYTGNGIINKAILGTGSGTLNATNTALFTEAYRNDVYSATSDDNVFYLTMIFTEEEVEGTFTEFGNCIDGTASADSGLLWSHLAGLNWVKDGVTALVIRGQYTFVSI